MILPQAMFLLAILGFLLTSLAAIGGKLLHEIPWHKLEECCRRKKRRDVFDAIHDRHDQLALGVECLQTMGTALFFLALLGWLTAPDAAMANAAWWVWAIWIVLVIVALLVATVWIPWAVTRVWAAPFLFQTWRIWWASSRLLSPCVAGSRLVEGLLRRLSGHDKHPTEEEAFEEEIRAIVTEGLHDGLLEADAREMIEGVIELGDVHTADIMTPRSQMDAIPVDLGWSEIMQRVIRCARTRIPVYEDTLDNIVGILYVKDLLPELAKPARHARRSLKEILRASWSVPKARRVDDLLQDFLKTRNHMAIVVDEYMGVAGLVTIEDVLEEIVGEIVDESDAEHVGEIRPLSDTSAEVHGRAHVTDVNEQLGLELDEPHEFDTIGGMVIYHLGHIPKPGESIHVDNVRLTVLEASRRKVERLRLDILKTA